MSGSVSEPPEGEETTLAHRPHFAYQRLSPGVPRESDVDDDELEALFSSPRRGDKDAPTEDIRPTEAQASGSAARASSDPLALNSEAAEADELDSSDGFVVLSGPESSGSTTPVPVAGPSVVKPQPRRKRLRVNVQIPFMPMDEVHTYILHGRARYPSERSRRRYAPLAYSDASTSEASSSRAHEAAPQRPRRALLPRSTGRNAGYRISSSSPMSSDPDDTEADFGGYGPDDWSPRRSAIDVVDDDDEEEEEVELIEASEDEMMARRVRTRGQDRDIGSRQDRHSRRDTRQTRPRGRRRDSSRRSASSSAGSASDSSGVVPRLRASATKTVRPPPRQARGKKRSLTPSEEEGNLSGSLFDGEDELDDDELQISGDEHSILELDESDSEDETEVLERHRQFCEKCSREPADEILEKALKRKKKPGRKRPKDEFEISDDELAQSLLGWVECRTCVVASHFGCLKPNQQNDVVLDLQMQDGPPRPGVPKRKVLEVDEIAPFNCARCAADPTCFVCHKDSVKPDKSDEVQEEAQINGATAKAPNGDEGGSEAKADDGKMEVDEIDPDEEEEDAGEPPLKFRCIRCKQAAHYEHLCDPIEGDESQEMSLASKAGHYQQATDKKNDAWFCHQCREWIWGVDIVIAWRPSPPDAKEPERDEAPHYKDALPREYLVKWATRGFRHATWVPHAWLLAMAPQRLKNFLIKGPSLDLITDETLAARGDDIADPTIAKVLEEDDQVNGKKSASRHAHAHEAENAWKGGGPPPDTNAEASIPVEWSTVDRVLDVMLAPPKKEATNDRVRGVQPPEADKIEIDRWEERTKRTLTSDDVDEVARLVTWCYIKWNDLQYDQSTWDTPPPSDSPLYPAFKAALGRYLAARQVEIPILSPTEVDKRESLARRFQRPPLEQPSCVVGGTLMPFQLEGFGWLIHKHFKRESCILADDMGLGKTVQIASMLGYLGRLKIYPCLVVVPNSTITNWVREFEKWVPHIRVVPYYGEAASRKVISEYELYHKGYRRKAAGLKAHVVLTTYDMITSTEFSVFKDIPRWEVLCVDEGQRLKSDGSLIFNRLKTLNSVHRILMTGTPLNNNIRELFNLLNFLDPQAFTAKDLPQLETRFAQDSLTDALIKELHTMVRPYILRRIKADVLKLPPKVEIIVPISFTPIQRAVYKTIFERNKETFANLIEAKTKAAAAKKRKEAAAAAAAAAEAAEADVAATTHAQAEEDGPAQSHVASGLQPMEVDVAEVTRTTTTQGQPIPVEPTSANGEAAT